MDTALFSALIESQGHQVLKAGNAADGLALARENKPDLIIMDVRLPDISGFDATRTLKAEDATRDIPIIVTSAYGPYADKTELRECGCDAYMATPIQITGFIDLIHSFLSRPATRKTG
jgi:two-component system cell cycle response regulator DivK